MKTSISLKKWSSIKGIGRHILLLIISIVSIGPLVWVVSISLKTISEFQARPFNLPQKFNLSSYVQVLSDERMLHFIGNSIYVTAMAILIVLVASVLAGYAIARVPFSGAKFLFVLFIISDAIPIFVVIVPLFVLINKMGISDSRWGLILPYAAMKVGLSTFIMRGFFRSISSEMEDAARIDGSGTVRMIWSIMLPLIRPGLLVVVIFNFISFWNEYFLASILLSSQDLYTLPAGLATVFMSKYATNWPLLTAGLVVSMIPTLLVFGFFQDKIIEGWTVTVK